MIHRVNDSLAVAYYYGYDHDGQRLWLIGISEGPIETGQAIRFEFQSVEGGSFGHFDSQQIIRSDWGSGVLLLLDCNSATMKMYHGYKRRVLQLDRLAVTSGTACAGQEYGEATDSVTGSWYEEQTSGQGFSVHKIDENRGVIYFYGYTDEGARLWLIGTWEQGLGFGNDITIEMMQASGGYFGSFDPDQIVRERWGDLTIRFDDCTQGWARLDGIHGVQEFDLDLLADTFGLECSLSGSENPQKFRGVSRVPE